MRTFSELKTDSAELVQRNGDETYETFLGKWLNSSLKFLARQYDYWLELRGEHNFTTEDGVANYYLPSDFSKPFRLFDITNDKKIIHLTEDEYLDANIAVVANANEADADTYYFKEVVGVKKQIATTGDTLQAKSSSASDTSVVVRVEGYLDSDLLILGFENITVTGIAATTATSPSTFYKITKVSKSADSVGYITLEDSSDNDLAILQDIDRVLFHTVIQLRKIPDDSTTDMRMLFKKTFRKLVNANDYPFVDCDEFLMYNANALALAQEKETVERASFFRSLAKDELQSLLSDQISSMGTDYQHKMVSAFAQAHRI